MIIWERNKTSSKHERKTWTDDFEKVELNVYMHKDGVAGEWRKLLNR
jgi:hypothetical protein